MTNYMFWSKNTIISPPCHQTTMVNNSFLKQHSTTSQKIHKSFMYESQGISTMASFSNWKNSHARCSCPKITSYLKHIIDKKSQIRIWKQYKFHHLKFWKTAASYWFIKLNLLLGNNSGKHNNNFESAEIQRHIVSSCARISCIINKLVWNVSW
jgi:hypothetical protein